jgi:serine/threonine-protein kinase
MPLAIRSMALADGMLYSTTNHGPVQALRASDGKQIWSWEGTRLTSATLTVTDDVIYVAGSTYPNATPIDADQYIYALSAKDGKLLWSYHADEPLLSAPVVAGGILYIGTGAHVDALRLSDRTLLWQSPLCCGGASREGYPHEALWGVALIAHGDTLYANLKVRVNDDPHNIRLEPTTVFIRTQDGAHLLRMGADGTGGDVGDAYPPVVVGDTLYVESTGGIWTYSTGQLSRIGWFHNFNGISVTGPTVADGAVYTCGADGNTYALAVSDGHELWHATTQGGPNLNHTPTVSDGVVFADGGTALFALRASDGAKLWRTDPINSPFITPPIIGG